MTDKQWQNWVCSVYGQSQPQNKGPGVLKKTLRVLFPLCVLALVAWFVWVIIGVELFLIFAGLSLASVIVTYGTVALCIWLYKSK